MKNYKVFTKAICIFNQKCNLYSKVSIFKKVPTLPEINAKNTLSYLVYDNALDTGYAGLFGASPRHPKCLIVFQFYSNQSQSKSMRPFPLEPVGGSGHQSAQRVQVAECDCSVQLDRKFVQTFAEKVDSYGRNKERCLNSSEFINKM